MAVGLVTVFGGSGFIGRHLVRRLARRGWVVRVVTRRPSRALYLKPMGDVGQIVTIRANLGDGAAVAAAVSGADAVVNLVGILSASGRQRFEAIHVGGARNVAAAAAEAGAATLVHVSAIGAGIDRPSAYARSKAAGEAALRAEFPQATILRPSVVFGPEDDFFNRFARFARLSPVLPLFGGGHTRFQPVYVGDVAEAIARRLEAPASRAANFELAGPKIYSFRELMALVLAETGRRRLLLPVPFILGDIQAAFLGLLPSPPITLDQMRLLRHDNVATGDMPGLGDLGISATAVELILPTYLSRFRANSASAPRLV